MGFAKRLPTPLGQRIANASGALYNRQGREFDVAIGGVPFMLATINDLPQSVETIKVRKDQFDTEDPGEQSLTGWWRRSQASFHEGAGDLYQETTTQTLHPVASNGFYQSSGIDVFTTQGKFTLLKRMVASTGPAASYTRVRSNTNGFSAVGDGALHTASAAAGPFASLHAPATKTIADGLVSNTQFYDVATDGTLYSGTVASPGTATTWPLGGAPTRILWGKNRLWVIGGRNIWQPDLTLAGGTAQNPIYTHPNAGWTFTCMAEGPSAMYFGGHDGFASSVSAVTLDGALTSTPYLTAATTTAVLPDGELVQQLAVVAGEFIAIGTNRGVRVGQINADGSLTYGPLIVEPTNVTSCTAITAQSRYFVVAFAATSGNALAYRIDTATQVSDGVFAYASDIDLGFVGSITSLCGPSSTQLVATGSDGKVYYQSTTQYVDYGFFQSGRIRYRTTEPKYFQFLTVGIEPLKGNIAVSLVKSDGSAYPMGNITTQGALFTDQFQYSGDPMEYASVKLELTPDAPKTGAPVVNSYLLRALPAVKPQRLITLPLMCFDLEQARSGQRYGKTGFSAARLQAMMALEDSADVLTYQDFSGGLGTHQVVIESLKFVNTAPTRGAQGTGGILLVELRTVDA